MAFVTPENPESNMKEASVTNTALERWKKESAEWQAISEEMIARDTTGCVTAYQVSLEQRKRMLARGERPVAYEEIVTAYEEIVTEAESSADPEPLP